MMVQHKEYELLDADSLVQDPANYAREHKLVGKHSREARSLVGTWRWPLLHVDKVADKLAGWLADAERIIDFGGAAGPLGYGSVVVDRIGHFRGLEEVPGQVDLIYTAHTLEHVPDLGLTLCSFHWKLAEGGRVVALVPSWRNEMLRADNWAHHAHTFCVGPGDYTDIVGLFKRHRLDPVLVAEGFQNIILFAEKR